MSDTPVGERPATGGRLRQYESDAERARAWRERHRDRRGGATEEVSVPLAEATLGLVVDQMRALLAGSQEALAALVQRSEDAIEVLSDPQAISDQLDAMREEMRLLASDAEAKVGASTRAQRAALAAVGAAEEAKEEAENAARAAWERVEALEAELGATQDSLHEATARIDEISADAESRVASAIADGATHLATVTADHDRAVVAMQRDHESAIAELRHDHASEVAAADSQREAALAALRLECAEAVQAANQRASGSDQQRARAEGAAAQLQVDVDQLRVELAEVRDALPTAVERARAELTESLKSRHRAELDVLVARHEGRVARLEGDLHVATAEAETVRERADLYRGEVERLTRLATGAEPATPARVPRSRAKTTKGSEQ